MRLSLFILWVVSLPMATWADTRLRSPGGAAAEASASIRVELGWPLSSLTIDHVLVSRASAPVPATLSFELPRDAAVIGLTVDGKVRAAAIERDAAARAMPVPPRDAAPDLALLRLVAEDTLAGDTAVSRYELHLFPVPAGRTLRVSIQAVTPSRYQGDRLSVRLPGRGRAPGLVAEQVTVVSAGGDLAGLDDVRVDRAAGARESIVAGARPRWRPRGPFARAAVAPVGPTSRAVVLGVALPPSTARPAPPFERIVFLIDGSASLGAGGRAAGRRAVGALLAAAPEAAEVECAVFDRTARSLLGGSRRNDRAGRTALDAALARVPLAHGSDLAAALDLAAGLFTGPERRTLIAIVTDGVLPRALDDQAAVARLGNPALNRAVVASIVLVPPDAALPEQAGGPLAELADRSGGRVALLRHGEAARAGGLLGELSPALGRLALDGEGLRGLDLPDHLAPGSGAVAIGWAGPGGALAITVSEGGLRLPATPAAGPREVAAALAVAHTEPGELLGPASTAASASDDDLAGWLIDSAVRAGVVSRVTSLVAHAPADRFGAARLALARRFGLSSYQRVPTPDESDIEDPVEVRLHPVAAAAPPSDRRLTAALATPALLGEIAACYRAAGSAERALTGDVALAFEIARDEIHRVEVDGVGASSPDVRGCLLDAAYRAPVPLAARGATSPVVVARVLLRLAAPRGRVEATIVPSRQPRTTH